VRDYQGRRINTKQDAHKQEDLHSFIQAAHVIGLWTRDTMPACFQSESKPVSLSMSLPYNQ